MTPEEMKTILDGQEALVRRLWRIESAANVILVLFVSLTAYNVLNGNVSTLLHVVNLIALVINMHALRLGLRAWLLSRRFLRDIAHAKETIELERIARL
jgi:hypothetical protein